jgi:hypothetical protein
MQSGISNLTLDNIFEQRTTGGETKAAKSMAERIANWRSRRLAQARRTRLFFHELRPVFPGDANETVTAYSDTFNQPLIVTSGITNMVTPLVRFSDTITTEGWSQGAAPVRVYGGLRPSGGHGNGHQRFAPQSIPADARITGDYRNVDIPGQGPMADTGRHIFQCYWIAPETTPASPAEAKALVTAEKRIKEGKPPYEKALPAVIELEGAADELKPGETNPNDDALLITGITCNFPAFPTPANARVMITDSSTSAAWMKKRITWWGVAGCTLVFDYAIFELSKPYYLPAGAVLRVEVQNTLAEDGAPIAAGEYAFTFIGETP